MRNRFIVYIGFPWAFPRISSAAYRLDYSINRVHGLKYPSIEDSDQQEKKAARAAGEMYFGVFVLFLIKALVEGLYGGKVEDLDGELEGKSREL